ncbi:MAG: GDP-mannose 4,6-dehydratase [Gemmataceae bacterium]|nr:GDP-mannose 4,6-dehydratase [Gemmataceae bacterium]
MRVLITGGAGFLGSHLAEACIERGDQVRVLDNLSTGSYENVRSLDGHPRFSLLVGSVTDSDLVREAVHDADAVFHLAAAVGVKLVMEQPLHTIETIVHGTEVVLRQANCYRKPVLLTSSSEVYGKSTDVPFDEDGDLLQGPTTRLRWAYACAKTLDEFLAQAYWRENRLPVVIARLFNTVGPRQTGRYGMVVPNFVRAALCGEPILVHGDGSQSRCFAHVADVVDGMIGLLMSPAAHGQVVNLGSTEEITILDLARKIKALTGSESIIRHVPYEKVYGQGFEDISRRVPSIRKAHELIGWSPRRGLDAILADVIHFMRSQNSR